MLIDLARKRRLFEVSEKLRESVTAEGPADDADVLIARHMAEVEQIAVASVSTRRSVTVMEAVDQAIEAGEARGRGEGRGILTGFKSLDDVLGELYPGGVYVLAGRPGSGKTSLGLQITLNVADQGHGVDFVSLEMQAAQLGRRALALKSGVPQFRLRDGSWDARDTDAIIRCKPDFARMPMSIEDQGGLNIQMIGLRAKAAMRRHGLKLLVVDHLHIVGTAAETTKMGATWAVEQVSLGLKNIAKELNIPVLALAQLNRGVEGRDDKRPNMADLRQAGSIEQDAEAIMLLYRAEYYLPKSAPERTEKQNQVQHEQAVAAWHEAKEALAGKAEVICDKVRDGVPCSVPMMFDGARTCFREIEA
ncbi:MAG: replicative DNA helicase, partial [Janthinobacterium lividum]